MRKNPFTPQIQSIIIEAEKAALSMHRHCLDIDLFLDSFLDSLSISCVTLLEKYDLKQKLYSASDSVIASKKRNKTASSKHNKDLEKFFSNCIESAGEMFDLDYVPPEIIFLNFLDVDYAPKAIRSVILSDKELLDSIITDITFTLSDVDVSMLFEDGSAEKLPQKDNNLPMFEKNEVLSQFSENLNIKALENKFDKIVDFDSKIPEMSTILCRKKKPNVILVGPAGTGKTSLVEGLVNKIVNGEAPELLSNKVVYSVSLSSMVAGTTYRGQFEQRLEEFVNEAKRYDNVILFIDEVHTLVGAGGSGGSNESLEASNILKPELARGTISCIGATTVKEYNSTIKKDSALDRRFERVIIREPSKFQMKKILPTIMSYYEEFHNVSYSEDFTRNVIDYCEKFNPNKNYPDKAVDVVDHCGAQAKVFHHELLPEIKDLQNKIIKTAKSGRDHSSLLEDFDKKLLAFSVERSEQKASVELSHLDSFFQTKSNPLCNNTILKEIFSDLGKKFAGHNKLINELMEKIIISNYNINSKNSSPSVFCINGDNKTGKSYLMNTFQENLERSGTNTIAYSGVHFSDRYATEKIASVATNGSSLSEKILMYPNSVVIIDDFDSIHPSSFSLFCQIFKDGKLELPNGECADFSHCKFFLTSKIKPNKSLGFSDSKDSNSSMVPKAISSNFSANLFLHKLDEKSLRRVIWSKLEAIKSNLAVKQIKLDFDFKFLKSFVKNNSGDNLDIQKLTRSFDLKINKYVQNNLIKGELKINLRKMTKERKTP